MTNLRIGLLTRSKDSWPSTQIIRALVEHEVEPVCFTFSDIIVNIGGKCEVVILGDGWTAVTKDGSLSAHFEHTIAITRDGNIVLTKT